jgi:hypothetical protein
MDNELKYPQKFAVLEVRERCGWEAGYEEKVRGYIPSKCYLLETKTKYLPNGNQKVAHEVVFPFTDYRGFKLGMMDGDFDPGTPSVPEYDSYGRLLNGETVEHVFDSFEEAEYLSKIMNEKLLTNLRNGIAFLLPDWQIKYHMKVQEFDREMFNCRQFYKSIQKRIDNPTKEDIMRLSKKPKEEKN